MKMKINFFYLLFILVLIPGIFSKEGPLGKLLGSVFCYSCCAGSVITRVLPGPDSSINVPNCVNKCNKILKDNSEVKINLDDESSLCHFVARKIDDWSDIIVAVKK